MEPERTTVAIQRYLDDLGGLRGDSPAEPVVHDLLGRAAQRLHLLCMALAGGRQVEKARLMARFESAIHLQRQGRLLEARAILGRPGDGGFEDLRQRIDRAIAELDLLDALEGIRMKRAESGQTDFGRAQADRAYQDSFKSAGLADIDESPPIIAQRIAASGARNVIVAALDDWAFCATDKGRLSWVLAIACRADPDPEWRDKVRNPSIWSDGAALSELARDATFVDESVPLLLVLGGLLDKTGGDAVGFLRRVQAVHPDDFWANFVLAETLDARADGDSIGYYRATLALRPHSVAAHVNLGAALAKLGRLAEAMDCWRRALQINPDSPMVHLDLAIALLNQGRHDEAVAQSEQTLRLDPQSGHAYAVLGQALLLQGRFGEAQPAIRRGLEILPFHDPMHALAAQSLERCDRMLQLEGRVSAIIQGDAGPDDAAECIQVAVLLLKKQRYAAAARFYADAFAAAPLLADDMRFGNRYDAACAAILAGCGRGDDAADLAEAQRARWRDQARQWLRAELNGMARGLEGGSAADRELVKQTLAHWRADPDLAALREPELLDTLPSPERDECNAIWTDAEILAKRLSEPAKPNN